MTELSSPSTVESPVAERRSMHATLLGTGSALPHRVIDNRYFVEELQLDTTPEWIVRKTGIEHRRYVEPDQDVLDLATDAGLAALEASGLTPDQLDLIVVATSSSPYAMPSTACLVQEALTATNAAAFDLNNACGGFAYAFDVAVRYLHPGPQNALIIGADLGSRQIDPQDRGTAIFFGDGAGATVLSSEGSGRVLGSRLYARGTDVPLRVPTGGTMTMDGRAIWSFVNDILPTTIQQLCDDAEVSPSDISLLVPHQANSKMIAAATESLGIPLDRIALNVHRIGNTLAASIPIALDEAVRTGRAQTGDLVLLVGFGAGLAWGGSLLQL
ncbi:MAG: 3-oxoacyl-ACP synthase III family protein [Planctomycetota bacterium]|jgi:3-oxoacyl-[acyl-carrier-protein] synthase-3